MNMPDSRFRRGRFFILLLAVFIHIGDVSIADGNIALFNQETETSQVETDSEDLSQPSFGPMVVKTIVLLILLIVLAYLALYFFKHFAYRKRGEGLSIRVAGSTLLGPKKSIYLVEIEDRRLVLGVTEAAISFLTELEKQSPDESPSSQEKKRDKNTGSRFQAFLDKVTNK